MAGELGKLSIELGGDTAGLDAAHSHTTDVLRQLAGNMERATSQATAAFSAMSQNVGVQLAAQVAAIKAAEASTSASLRNMATNARLAGLAIGAAFVGFGVFAALRAIEQSVIDTMRAFDSAAVSAEKLGLTVEQFSNLSFAARAAAGSALNFDAALKSLIESSQKTDDAYATSTRALKAMGVTLDDLSDDPAGVERALISLANRFQAMEGGVNKTALAVALFGSQGEAMLPFLDRGAAGISELIAQSQRFAATISGEAAQASSEYVQNMRRLDAVLGVIKQNITQEFIPSFNNASKSMLAWAEAANIGARAGYATRAVFVAIDTAVRAVLEPLRLLATGIGGIFSSIAAAMRGDFTAAGESLLNLGGDLKAVWDAWGERNRANADYLAGAVGQIGAEGDRVRGKLDWSATIQRNAAPLMESVEAMREAERAAAERNRVIFDQLMRDDSLPITDKLAQLHAMLQSGAITWRQYSTAIVEAEAQTSRLNAAFNQLQLRDLVDNRELPMTEKVRQLNEMVRSGEIGWRDYLSATQDVKQQGAAAMDELLSASSSALTQIFEGNKTAAIASALINTYQGISKALAQYGPTPQGFAMAGIAAAVGFAQVMRIRSTSKTSSGGGGASGVSGGSGAAAAAASAPAAAPASNSTLFVRGIDPRQMFSGEAMRALAAQMIQFQRDGGRVVLEGA